MFMQHLATRIVELDRGKIFSWSCDYPTFLERKAQALEVEAAQRIDFDRKLAEEEVWIRKGVKARRTRNEGRVKALERLREEKQDPASAHRPGAHEGPGIRSFRAFGHQSLASWVLLMGINA